jgi:hypothetical protein
MLSRSMLKAWIVCWFELANLWLPFFVGAAQREEAARK